MIPLFPGSHLMGPPVETTTPASSMFQVISGSEVGWPEVDLLVVGGMSLSASATRGGFASNQSFFTILFIGNILGVM